MNVTLDVGGRPGRDCGGFCSFCYFKGVDYVEPTGCRSCKVDRRGCTNCSQEIVEILPGFKPLNQLLFEMDQKTSREKPDTITIEGNGDVSCFSDLQKLLSIISAGKVPVFLDYTSGKGFTTGKEADALVDAGVRRVGFSVFSTNPELRRRHVNDRHPEVVLSNLRTFCERSDLYAMVVLIPGINDGAELEKTCRDLEDMGAKGLMLMLFANSSEQGLIFGNAPLIPGIVPHTVEELRDIATKAQENYNKMRIIGTPLWDPQTGAPFALAHHRQEIRKLPAIEKEATLVTSSVAFPLLSSIFRELGGDVNVVPVRKQIGNLITQGDFESLNLREVKERVIIPGMTLAHDSEIRKALRRDGNRRLVFRGPDDLSVESEKSIYMEARQVLDFELEAFTALIEEINELGV